MCGNCSDCKVFVLLTSLLARLEENVNNRIKTTSRYTQERDFFLHQLIDLKSKLAELISFEFNEVKVTMAYFGLGEYDIPHSQEMLSKLFKLSTGSINNKISSILCYLDCPGKWGVRPKQLKERIQRRVIAERKRRLQAKEKGESKAEDESAFLEMNGIPSLPKGIPREMKESYVLIYKADRDGRIDWNREEDELVLIRFGFLDGEFKSIKKASRIVRRAPNTIKKAEEMVFRRIRT